MQLIGPLGHKARDAVLAGATDYEAWNDQPVATGSARCKRSADGLNESSG